MTELVDIVDKAQDALRTRLERLEADGGLTRDMYVRYLTMQYHLTKGVQRHFFAVASHSDLARRRTFRNWLVNFGNEEELHYEIAGKDLMNMGSDVLPTPVDVRLWWAFFDKMIQERPFVRLGGTAILENLAGKSRDVLDRLFKAADYAKPENTKFVVIHRHEQIPHGEQVMEALGAANLEKRHFDDICEGARVARVLYMRMLEWCFTGREAV